MVDSVTWFQGTGSLYWVKFHVNVILGILQMFWQSHVNLPCWVLNLCLSSVSLLMWSAIQEGKTHRNTRNKLSRMSQSWI